MLRGSFLFFWELSVFNDLRRNPPSLEINERETKEGRNCRSCAFILFFSLSNMRSLSPPCYFSSMLCSRGTSDEIALLPPFLYIFFWFWSFGCLFIMVLVFRFLAWIKRILFGLLLSPLFFNSCDCLQICDCFHRDE